MGVGIEITEAGLAVQGVECRVCGKFAFALEALIVPDEIDSIMTTPIIQALPERSFWARQRLLILRRVSQFLIILIFLAGPWFGVWIAKGNLSASLILK